MNRVKAFAVMGLAAIAVLGVCATVSAQPKPTLKIGVTLHPYYSWTKNIVGDLPGYEVRSILPGEIDAGDYQLSALGAALGPALESLDSWAGRWSQALQEKGPRG